MRPGLAKRIKRHFLNELVESTSGVSLNREEHRVLPHISFHEENPRFAPIPWRETMKPIIRRAVQDDSISGLSASPEPAEHFDITPASEPLGHCVSDSNNFGFTTPINSPRNQDLVSTSQDNLNHLTNTAQNVDFLGDNTNLVNSNIHLPIDQNLVNFFVRDELQIFAAEHHHLVEQLGLFF